MGTIKQALGAQWCGLIFGIAGLMVAGQTSAQLSVTPITWDVVGLDHNRPLTSGPELFPVGAEVCTAVATTDVVVDFVWPDGDGNGWDILPGHPYINLRPGSLTSLSFATLGAGECVDAYFELQLTRSAVAFGQSREYVIQAADGVESASSPSSRAIHVEYLVSQNRNTTQQIRYGQQQDHSDWVVLGSGGSINLAVDETYFIELTTQTSTAYEELQSFVTLSNTIFQVISVSTTYSNLTAPPSRVPVPNPSLWADGCLWDSDLDSPNYLSCLADGKAGGVVVTIYEIRIISGGGDSVGLEALIYDRSGGSFHYNTDFSESPGDLNTFDPTDSDISKRFVPGTIGIGGTSRLRFTISNPNPIEVLGYNFIDNLPPGVVVASPPNASTSCGGIWNPLASETVLAFDGGTIVANGSCTILVDVTAVAAGTYDNLSNNLFIGATDTGNSAGASLEVSATPPPVVQCNDLATLALWQFPIGGDPMAPASTSNLVTVSAAAGSGLIPTIDTDTVDVGTGSWRSDFINQGALVLANNEYFEFVIDTTGLDSITLDFSARRTSQGPQNIQLYYGSTGVEFASSTYTVGTTFLSNGPTTISSNLNPSGDTRFRLYVYNAGQNVNGHAGYIDSVRFRGLFCQPVPPPPPVPGVNPPQISKSFSPDPIGVGHQTTLTFTVNNPNPATPLSGIAVSDEVPSGVGVLPATFGGTCIGYWGLDPSDSSVLLHSGGTLAGGGSCTLTVDLTASTVGTTLNISDLIYATESSYNFDLTTGVAQAELDVLAPPTIAKDFDPNLILLGVTPDDAATLTFTITNPNPDNAIGDVSFTDTFPASLVVATTPNASTAGCGTPTWSPTAAAGSVSFSSGSVVAGGACVVSLDVTGPSGVYPNTSSAVSHIVSGVSATNGGTASSTVEIDDPIPGLAFLKQVGIGSDPDGAWSRYLAVETGDPVYYKITLENTGEVPLTGITVSDPLVNTSSCIWPVSLPVADAATPLAHIAVCIVGPVTSVAGVQTNTASVTTTEVPGPTTSAATYATVVLSLNKVASPLTYTTAGDVISYTFTVTNTGAAILPGPVTITDPLVPGASCPSLTTVGNNDNFFDPLEAIVCTGTYTIQAADVTAGSVTNTALASLAGFDSSTDSATVTLPIAEPTIGKVFGTDPVAVGGTSVLTITTTNNAAIALSNVAYSDVLPTGLSFVSGTIVGNCGGGTTTISTTTNPNDTFTLSGGAIAASGNCTVAITVSGDVAGNYTNTTSVVSSTEVTGTTTGSDTLEVTTASLSASKTDSLLIDNDGDFVADPGDTLRYTVVITNTGTTGATTVLFTDSPDTNTTLVVGSVTTSQGAVTTGNTGGDSSVAVDIGTLAASGSVTISFDVTVDSPFPTTTASVANQGTVTADGGISVPTDDPDTPVVNDPTVTPVEDPGVEVTKADALVIDADGNTFPSPGDTIEYTVEITNTGNIDLTVVTFSDTPDANTALVVGSVTSSQGTVTSGNTGGDTSVGVDVSTVAVGATVTVTFRVTIDTPLPVGVTIVSNQGTVTTNETPDEPTDDPDTGPDDDPTDTPVTAAPILDAEKADALQIDADLSGGASPGDTVRYTVTVQNTGNTDATVVAFGDTIPTNTTVVAGSVTTSQGTVNSEDPVDVTIGTIATSAMVTITFDVLIDNPLPGGVTQIANQGTVSSTNHPDVDTDDPDTPATDDPTVTPLTAEPIIEASKTDTLFIDADGSTDVSPGDTLSYSVTIDNTGNTEATGVVFADVIPANTVVVAGSVTTSQGTVDSEDPVQVTVGTIPAGDSATLSFQVLIDSPLPAGVTQVSNQGTVSSNEVPDEPTDDPDTPTDDDPTDTPVNGTPDLSITKDDGGITSVPGALVTYTLSYANSGSQDATGVVITDTVPVSTTFNVGASTAGWSCVPDNTAGSICTLSIGAVAVGGSGTATFVIVIDNPVPVGFTQVANTASIADDGANGTDPTPGDNSDSDTTPITAAAAVTATKADSLLIDNDGDLVADPGDTLRYTVVITNTGTTGSTTVLFTDSPDTNTTLVVGSVTTSQGTVTTGNTGGDTIVAVDIGTLAASGSVTITFDVTVNSPFPTSSTSVANQGTVTADGGISVPTDDPDTPVVDDSTITPVEDPGVEVTKADALVIDADGNTFPSPGDTLEYTVEITNTGNIDLTVVTFSDTPDANTALVVGSVTSSQGAVTSGNTGGDTSVGVDVGTVVVGATVTVTFRVTIDSPIPVGVTIVSNQGTVTTNETPDEPTDDPDTGTDDDPTDTPVTSAPVLDAEKADALQNDADGNSIPSPGDTIRYTVTIQNTGNTDATAVVFNDGPDVNTTLVVGSVTTSQGTVTTGNTAGDSSVGVDVGDVGVNTTITITFDVLIDNPLPGGVTQIVNQGTVSSTNHPDIDTDDPDTPVTDDPTVTPLTAEPIIEASKTDTLLIDADGSTDVSPGDTLSYSVAIDNTGNTEATGVVFADGIPANTAVVAGSVTTSQGTVDSEDPVQVTVGTILAGGSATLSFQVLIDSPLPAGVTQVSNQGTVSSNEVPDEPTDDPDTPTDDDPTDTPVNGTPDLSITKDDGGITSVPGALVAYTLSYDNSGSQGATGVVITDTVPANTTFNAGASTAGWTCVPDNSAGSICTLSIGAVAVGGSGTATFAIVIDNPVPVGFTQVANTSSIADDGANGADPTPGDNSNSDTTPITAAAAVTATKADSLLIDNDGDFVADPGDTLRYTVVITNTGTTGATTVLINDSPDTNTTLVVGSVTTSQGAVTTGNTGGDTSVAVDIGTLAASGSVTITFDVTVNSPFPTTTASVANQGTVTADGGISVPTDDPDTPVVNDPTVTPVEDPGVEVTKTDVLVIDADGNTFPSPGDTLEYTVEITNTGNIDLTVVTFSDTPDANTALVVGSVTSSQGTVTSGNTGGDTSVGVDVGTVAVGATVTVTFRVTIDTPLPVGVTNVSNQGTVTTNETPDEPTDDPDTGTDDDPTDTPVTSAPVLDAEKTDALQNDADGNSIPSPGDTIRYTVTIQNTGNTDATAVVFNDGPDVNTTLVVGSVTTSQGTVTTGNTIGDSSVGVDVGDVGVNTTITITFDVLIDNPLPGSVTQIANQGTVSSTNHPDVDTDDPDTPATDDPTVTPLTAEPIIEASKTDTLFIDADGSTDVSPGDTLSYSVTIDNTGNTEATGVVFTDVIPANTAVVAGSVTTSQGTVDSEDPVQVTVGTIPAAGSATLSFQVLIDSPLPAGVTQISNQGTVSSNEVPDEPTDDPDTPTDDDPTDTPVNGTPDLSITKDDGGITSVPGALVAYTLNYANGGSQDATGVVITDTVPASTTFNAGASTAGWSCVPDNSAGSNCTLSIGAVAVSGSGAATFAIVIDNPVPVGFTQVVNTALIADDGANGADPTPGDNSDSDNTPVITPSLPSIDALKSVEQITDFNGNMLADAGELLRYTVTVMNDGDTLVENVVLRDTPDSATTLVSGSVTTTLGTVTIGNAGGDTSVEVVFGDLGVAQTVVVTFEVTINNPVPVGLTQVDNQGIISSDTVPDEPTDDPGTSPVDDPTVTELGQQQIGAIPDLGVLGQLLLVLTLAVAGALVIRRRLI